MALLPLRVMETPTRGVREAINRTGIFEHPLSGTRYPKVQVITVAELLEGKRSKIPTAILPYVKAKPRPASEQASFDV